MSECAMYVPGRSLFDRLKVMSHVLSPLVGPEFYRLYSDFSKRPWPTLHSLVSPSLNGLGIPFTVCFEKAGLL